MDNCIIAKGMIDSIGHYSRLDILSLTVNTEIMEHVRYLPEGDIVTVDKN
jgi:hypothetical protein